MDRLFASFQEKTDEANAANEARYGEAKGLLEELRTRNQDRVDSFGRSAQADIEERVAENLGDVRAELSGRGLANSNILPAFMMRAERDKMRELNRIDEARDARAADYDSRDTGNIARLIESRNDIAPDYSMLADLALKYGQSGANETQSLRDELQQLREQMTQQANQSQQQIVPRRTVGPIYSAGTPIVGNYGPLNMAQNFLGNVNSQIGYGNWRRNSSDMYPTNRHGNRTNTQATSPSLTVGWLDTMARTA